MEDQGFTASQRIQHRRAVNVVVEYVYKTIRVFLHDGTALDGDCVGVGDAEDYELDSDVIEIDTADGKHLCIEQSDIDYIKVLKDDGTYDKIFGTSK